MTRSPVRQRMRLCSPFIVERYEFPGDLRDGLDTMHHARFFRTALQMRDPVAIGDRMRDGDSVSEDPMRAARGLLIGLMAGSALWACIAVLITLA